MVAFPSQPSVASHPDLRLKSTTQNNLYLTTPPYTHNHTTPKHTLLHAIYALKPTTTITTKMSFDSPLPPYNASDPSATFFNSSCLDLLLIELVPMAYRLANELQPGSGGGAGGAGAGAGGGARADGAAGSAVGGDRTGDRVVGGGGGGGGGSKIDEDEERDAVFYRLEMLGYRVGQGLVERYVSLLSL